MIDREHPLPVTAQCQLLQLPRSTAYYRSELVSGADLALMRRIDELHLDYPFAGSRMLRDLLGQEGVSVGRRHVRTLMRKMGLEALYRKPNTSRRDGRAGSHSGAPAKHLADKRTSAASEDAFERLIAHIAGSVKEPRRTGSLAVKNVAFEEYCCDSSILRL